MLVEFSRGAARLTMQIVSNQLYINGDVVDIEDAGGDAYKMFHRLYVEYKLQGWKELQVYF